ncbi:MAG TPA: response regulator transcription factor [Devosia sp.]|uniref:response regulator transcription factor n=1 Tax=Devosia sp. TaxID=1871048 RepID=UPI002F9513FB
MTKPVSVVIVDNQVIFRLGLHQVLSGSPTVQIIAEGSDAMEAIALAKRFQPDVLLVGFCLQSSKSGDILGEIVAASPNTKILVLATSEDTQDVVAAMAAGASGFVSKQVLPDELVLIIHSIDEGETYLSPKALTGWLEALKENARITAAARPEVSLTTQELAVLAAISEGDNNREVASRLGISAATVKYHLAHIFAKLGVRNRVEAAVLAGRLLGDAGRHL